VDPYQNRRWVIIISIFVIGLIFTVRLLYVQVLTNKWADRAEEISVAEKVLNPSRGLIFDRNGKILVESMPVYDLLLNPDLMEEGDSAALCELLDLSPEQYQRKYNSCEKTKNQKDPQPFERALTQEDFTKMSFALEDIEAITSVRRYLRGYPHHVAAHVLGYIGAINGDELAKDKSSDNPYYTGQDYIGKTGIEKIYEKELRGERGVRKYLRDKSSNEVKIIEEVPAISGQNLHSTIDIELQKYAESLMSNKIGSVVAIEPKSGEILTILSAPFYDPAELVGRDLGKNYNRILNDTVFTDLLTNKAVFNDEYRPGSIFKLVQSLVAMQEGAITANTGFPCDKTKIGCHNHEHPGDVATAIQHSCNPYFYFVYQRMIQSGLVKGDVFRDSRLGIEKWSKNIKSFGLGVKLNSDIQSVGSGRVPDANYYDNEIPRVGFSNGYGKLSWAFSTIRSNSIGEGEIGVSPLQMANIAAIIANKGYYYTPHIIKAVGDNGAKKKEFTERHYTMVDSVHFAPVIMGMERVVQKGTGKRAQVEGINVCGKTGTVQNPSDKINDHSVFVAFAPKEDPKIAVAVYVEYGTWGGTWAAPIASLIIEKYLKEELSVKGKKKEELVLGTSILTKNQVFK